MSQLLSLRNSLKNSGFAKIKKDGIPRSCRNVSSSSYRKDIGLGDGIRLSNLKALNSNVISQSNFVCRAPLFSKIQFRHLNSSRSVYYAEKEEDKSVGVQNIVDSNTSNSVDLRNKFANLKPSFSKRESLDGSNALAKKLASSSIGQVSSEEPRFWTKPEPKPAPPPPAMSWSEWLKDPQAIKKSCVEGFRHYRDGFKLLYYNIVQTIGIIRRYVKGEPVTRRERSLLVRTTSDLFRFVPFAIIIVIPFLEFALPILLKLFPNMLPSTFTDKLQAKENLRRQLNLKIEMARFLQDTLVEMKSDVKNAETSAFLEKLRSGEGVTTDELVQYAKVFREDLTLNGLQRNQLTAMCRMLGIPPFGTDSLLILQIQRKVASLKKDDRAIMEEGIDTLSTEELQHAVLARGMYSQTTNKRVLKNRLKGWLDMSITKNVPITLLLLSRAFALNSRVDLAQTLKDTFAHMPPELIDEIESRVGNSKRVGRKVDRALKLEALEQFRALVEEERAAYLAQASKQSAEPSSINFQALATLTAPTELERLQVEELRAEVAHIKAEVIDDVKNNQAKLEQLSQQLQADKNQEREQMLLMRKAGQETETDEQFEARWAQIEKDLMADELNLQKQREAERKAVRQLENRVVNLLAELGVDVVETKRQLEEELKVLDKNYDGLISEDELKYALETLQHKLTDSQIEAMLDRLDADHDGLIEVEHLLKVAREMDIDLPSAVAEAKKRDALIKAKTAEATESTSASSSDEQKPTTL